MKNILWVLAASVLLGTPSAAHIVDSDEILILPPGSTIRVLSDINVKPTETSVTINGALFHDDLMTVTVELYKDEAYDRTIGKGTEWRILSVEQNYDTGHAYQISVASKYVYKITCRRAGEATTVDIGKFRNHVKDALSLTLPPPKDISEIPAAAPAALP